MVVRHIKIKKMRKMKKTFIKTSTKAFFRLHGWRHLTSFIHGYVYVRWLVLYVKILLRVFRVLVKALPGSSIKFLRPVIAYIPDHYHAKVLIHEDAKKIVTLDVGIDISKEKSEQVIPFEVANRILIENPDSIVVIDCACRKEKKEPCQPLNVCMAIGEPYAGFIFEHAKALNPRRVSQGEAIEILEACHKRGNVHNAYFKDVMAGRFYAICNCCKCCCGGIEGQRMLRTLPFKKPVNELISSGYLAEINHYDCTFCEECISICPFEAIFNGGDKIVINNEFCMGCGVCVDSCPGGAISLKRDPSRSPPMDINALVK